MNEIKLYGGPLDGHAMECEGIIPSSISVLAGEYRPSDDPHVYEWHPMTGADVDYMISLSQQLP